MLRECVRCTGVLVLSGLLVLGYHLVVKHYPPWVTEHWTNC
jgi:hypothetical protein